MSTEYSIPPLTIPVPKCPCEGCDGTVSVVSIGFSEDCHIWACSANDWHWWDEDGEPTG